MTTSTNNEGRILVVAKGFQPLQEKGVKNLIKVCEDFLANGTVKWAMADYMGITGAGKGAEKHKNFLRQLEDNADVEACVKLHDLSSQVVMAMSKADQPIVTDKVALRAYFTPLLKSRGVVAVPSNAVAVDEEAFEAQRSILADVFEM